MKLSLLRFLRCPATGEELDAHAFTNGTDAGRESEIHDGVLLSRTSNNLYAIQSGVPIMLAGGPPREFNDRYRAQIADVVAGNVSVPFRDDPQWSFSTQWRTQGELGVERTWGFSVESRLEQTLLEIGRPREWFNGKVVLDAGCGNGRLTERVASLGAEAIGIDFSSSVMQAEAQRRSPNVHFVRGDLQKPPFAAETFDVVFSNGVLHHTPNTEHTFAQVAKCVKSGGAFYLWLYSRPEDFGHRYVYYGAVDSVRAVASRLPPRAAMVVVRAAARLARVKYRLTGRQKDTETFEELVIGLMDTLTPRWRHYHTPVQVARWYFDAGFGAPTLTHWDNPYGFGVVADRVAVSAPPGTRFDTLRDSK